MIFYYIISKKQDVVASKLTKVNVDSLDVARIIKKYSQSDNVIVKIDVEGAEYDLLLDFIKKDVLKLIDHIAVEFHSYVSPFKSPEDVFISLIKLSGVEFSKWTK